MSWFPAFLFTQAFEVPIYLVVMDRQRLPFSSGAQVAIAFGASALTHPIVWFVIPKLGLSYTGYVALAEVFAVGAEALYFARFGVRRALLWSFVANATSASLGLLSRWAFGFP